MPTRDQLLSWGIRTKKPLDLGDGLTLTVQQLNAAELQDVVKIAKQIQAKSNDDEHDNVSLCASIICRSAINDDGSRIFIDGDETTLVNDWSYAKLAQLVEPVFELNGLLKDQADVTEKN